VRVVVVLGSRLIEAAMMPGVHCNGDLQCALGSGQVEYNNGEESVCLNASGIVSYYVETSSG
jgi:hypothetical protein